ncbi:Uncharacterised protein [Mycobacteroides abscessus subsp. abscessus]|nr:Uncharacterised protein [Mycobacteroides abscessus subsp. abscessus]
MAFMLACILAFIAGSMAVFADVPIAASQHHIIAGAPAPTV